MKRDLRFDAHLNVGKVYQGKTGSVEMFYSGKEIADYCNHFNLTHAICIYDEYENLKELIDNTNTKIYGVQWIVDNDQELDCGKEGWHGIKLHSHRGYRDGRKYDVKHPKRKRSEKEQAKVKMEMGELRSFGMDYADGYIKEILERLPQGSLVYMHSQGWPSLTNRARPEHLFMLATEFYNLKFIMGHAGGYGGMVGALPGPHVPPTTREKSNHVYSRSIRNYVDSVMTFKASAHYANSVHNLFLDSSCYTPDKAIALRDTNKWCVGSDYPFGANKPRNSEGNDESNHWVREDFNKPYVWNFNKQTRLFIEAMGEDAVQEGFQSMLDYCEKTMEELAQEQFDKINELKVHVKAEKTKYKNNES